MNFYEIAEANEKKIGENSYPGRGIIIGMTPDGRNYVQVYWIMGRSSNSRNRVFEMDGSDVRTKAFDESKLEDPSLIIYYPIKTLENYHIVTNGDQTDTIYGYLTGGLSFEAALKTREFEPDAPNYTPRISGIVDISTDNAAYSLSILKSINNNGDYCQRNFYNYDRFLQGFGHCIHTYREDGNPIPSFDGDPFIVKLSDDINETAEYYWKLLNEDNRISLLVKFINVEDKSIEYKIINKNK